VEPFGAALHLRVDADAWDATRARAALAAAGARELSVEEGAPSLEDVFLAVVGRAPADGGGGRA
jgi:hypothetical protein